MDDIGFYNKYLLMNNSYLVKHIVWDTVKKNKNSKNLNKIIDQELVEKKISKPKPNYEYKNISKVSKLLRNNIIIKNVSDKWINTENIIKIDQSTNTKNVNKLDKTTSTEIKKYNFLNNENGSLYNRLKNYKN